MKKPLQTLIFPLFLCLFACTSNVEERLALAKLSQSCILDSDCKDPLVCAFGKCHTECVTSRDCDDAARCVAGERPHHVCQLPDEVSCLKEASCPGTQVCSIDAECRDGCLTERDCVMGQSCASGACADPEELTGDGALAPSEDRPSDVPLPCQFNSDCAEGLACRSGLCAAECSADKDCPGTLLCDAGRCVTSTVSVECIRHSDCKTDEICEDGACAPLFESDCTFNSDCGNAGEVCVAGVCQCACSTTTDCPASEICENACGCVAGRVVIGDVTIANSAQLRELFDVAEIKGSLKIEIVAGAALPIPLRIPHLKKVTALVASSNYISELVLDSLETVPGGIFLSSQNLELASFPLLTETGNLQLSAVLALKTFEVPALTTAAQIYIADAPLLPLLEFPSLETSGDVYLGPTLGLKNVKFPSLSTANSLSVLSGGTAVLEVPLIETLLGGLTLKGTGLSTQYFPSLTKTGVTRIEGNPQLETLHFSLLAESAGDLFLQNNPQLKTVAFPLLTKFAANGYFSNNAALAALNFPELDSAAAQLRIEQNSSLSLIFAPVCSSVSVLYLNQNQNLISTEFPALTSLDTLYVGNNGSLTNLDLRLVGSVPSSLTLTNNPALASLAYLDASKAGSLKTVGDVTVTNNALLGSCLVDELKAALTSYDSFTASGNLPCP